MKKEGFICPDAGTLVQTQDNVWAFVPATLPPHIEYTPELVMALSAADTALSTLSALGRQLPNPHLLILPYTNREAVLSSNIEGTQASMADLYLDEIEDAPQVSNDIQEVRNYVHALEHGLQRLREDFPLSLRLVREMHEILMSNTRGAQRQPGEFRANQNFIDPPGAALHTATFVPPPVPEMLQGLNNWEVFLHKQGELPDLIQCALMHVQFETLHPFYDGNGRIGRLMITLFLIGRDKLSQPLLYLSAFIEAHKSDYYSLLQGTRTHCAWHEWLMFFLNGVRVVADDAAQQAKDLFDLREKFRGQLADQANALVVLDALFFNPYINAKRATKVLKKSDPTARTTINVLEEHGILSKVSEKEWGKLYVARPILEIIERRLD